jgi:anti-anti-sigma regulatory factor
LPELPAPHPVAGRRPRLVRRGDAFVFRGSIDPADVPALCERARDLFGDARTGPVICRAGALRPDLATVEVLARLGLIARQVGVEIRLEGVSPALRELVRLVGLSEVLCPEPGQASIRGGSPNSGK